MKVPTFLIPVLIVALTAGGLGAAHFIKIPTAVMSFQEIGAYVNAHKATFIVEGVSCKDRAMAALGTLSGFDGIYKVTAYASYNRIDVLYDPQKTGVSEIGKRFEGPVYIEETGEYIFNMFKVIKIDG